MREWLRSLFSRSQSSEDKVRQINERRTALANASDETLRETARRSTELIETLAVTAVVAARVLGLVMFDVQIQGAVALAEGPTRPDRVAPRHRQPSVALRWLHRR